MRWWEFLTMITAGNMAKLLASVNHYTKRFYHYYHLYMDYHSLKLLVIYQIFLPCYTVEFWMRNFNKKKMITYCSSDWYIPVPTKSPVLPHYIALYLPIWIWKLFSINVLITCSWHELLKHILWKLLQIVFPFQNCKYVI